MAGLIPTDEMTELKSASAVSEVAKEAVAIIEKQTVAYAINQAANTGEHSITYSKIISDELQELLRAQGYKVTRNSRAADPNKSWTISF